jgi:hypothetical protein
MKVFDTIVKTVHLTERLTQEVMSFDRAWVKVNRSLTVEDSSVEPFQSVTTKQQTNPSRYSKELSALLYLYNLQCFILY